MLVAFAQNQVLYAKHGTAVTIDTDPVSMAGSNHAEITFHIHNILQAVGTPTVTLSWKGRGSNDGQTWFDVTGLTGSETEATYDSDVAVAAPADVTAAFLKLEMTLDVTGSANDLGFAVFDLHGNLTQK